VHQVGYLKETVQRVTVLNTVGNCNTMVSIIVLYYNIMGPRYICSGMVPGSIPGGVTEYFVSMVPPDGTVCPEVDSASENEYKGFLLG
jgi:hypothetical protein